MIATWNSGDWTTMQLDFTPFDPTDKIAELICSLTYGDMIDFAAELWKAAGDVEISAETLPAILHHWASETRHSAPQAPRRCA
jgi:hypothetical protein